MIKRLKQYFINRRGMEVLPVRLHWRRLYVLPAKPGLFFFVIASVMMLAGLNFNNNMSLMLVFLLFGVAQVALYKTFLNLKDVVIAKIHSDAVFLGESLVLKLQLTAAKERHQIVVSCDASSDCQDLNKSTGLWQLQVASQKRGYQSLPRLKLMTRYPLGLFTVWAYCQPKESALIYPRPEQPLPAFPQHGGIDGSQSSRLKGDEMDSLRHYHQGDPIRDIAWKKSAQTQQTYVKEYHLKQGRELLFDYQQVYLTDSESRLSRLTAWVVAAEQQQLNYQLSLPGFTSTMSRGDSHYHNCLKALALFRVGGDS